jgi:enamine deaminase RidA (YjgF/YER057c/UK114 family)
MNKELVISAFNKVFDNEILTEEELDSIKNFINMNVFLSDMDDYCRKDIMNTTIESFNEIFKEVLSKTIERTFSLRF